MGRLYQMPEVSYLPIHWHVYDDIYMATKAARMLERMTGDPCRVRRYEQPGLFAIARTDTSEKEVRLQ